MLGFIFFIHMCLYCRHLFATTPWNKEVIKKKNKTKQKTFWHSILHSIFLLRVLTINIFFLFNNCFHAISTMQHISFCKAKFLGYTCALPACLHCICAFKIIPQKVLLFYSLFQKWVIFLSCNKITVDLLICYVYQGLKQQQIYTQLFNRKSPCKKSNVVGKYILLKLIFCQGNNYYCFIRIYL